MVVSVLQMELDSIKMKETDNPQTIDDKFSKLARLHTASGSVLSAVMKKTPDQNHAFTVFWLHQQDKPTRSRGGHDECVQ